MKKIPENSSLPKYLFLSAAFLFLFISQLTSATQSVSFDCYYRVYFNDKGQNQITGYSLSDLVTQKSIDRRNKLEITDPDFCDIPVSEEYLNQISQKGFTYHCSSKWMNTALFKSVGLKDLNEIRNLSFVKEIKIVKSPSKSLVLNNKLESPAVPNVALPPFDKPVTMVNGNQLLLSGYDGENVSIAVLDAGFTNFTVLGSLSELNSRKGIAGTYDFILKNKNVAVYSDHGTAVLTVLAGKSDNQILGTARGADYWLFRTEDVNSEYPVEEDYWIAAAERADSIGVDIISTSLGYSEFDDPSMNYKFSDMDGKTTFITRAAEIASSKGILVISSAGNERTKTWQRIVAPTDGKSVLSVGAVDGNEIIAGFSSAGPSYDRRIKPDVVAMGVNVPVQVSEFSILRASGTSFSCPVISGLCACLIQAIPEALNTDIINALQKSSDRHNSPDSLYGYGLPDFVYTLQLLQNKYLNTDVSETVISPNPVSDEFKISFSTVPGKLTIEIYNIAGTLVYSRKYPEFISRTLTISELRNLSQGVYIIRIKTETGTFSQKVIKINSQV